MQRLLILFLMLPWWAYLPMAGGVLWLFESQYRASGEIMEIRAEALAQGAPDLVDLSDFDRETDRNAAEEVNVRGWINPDYNYELVKKTNGLTTGTRYMLVLFGSGDDETARTARAAIVMTKAERTFLFDHIDDFLVGRDGERFFLDFNGFGRATTGFSSLVTDALREQNLTRSDDFFFLVPFPYGREVALTLSDEFDEKRHYGWLFAALLAMFGGAKLGFGRFIRPGGGARKQNAPAPTASPQAPVVPAQTGPVMKPQAQGQSPLGRLNQKIAVRAATGEAPKTSPGTFSHGPGAAPLNHHVGVAKPSTRSFRGIGNGPVSLLLVTCAIAGMIFFFPELLGGPVPLSDSQGAFVSPQPTGAPEPSNLAVSPAKTERAPDARDAADAPAADRALRHEATLDPGIATRANPPAGVSPREPRVSAPPAVQTRGAIAAAPAPTPEPAPASAANPTLGGFDMRLVAIVGAGVLALLMLVIALRLRPLLARQAETQPARPRQKTLNARDEKRWERLAAQARA